MKDFSYYDAPLKVDNEFNLHYQLRDKIFHHPWLGDRKQDTWPGIRGVFLLGTVQVLSDVHLMDYN